MPAFRAAVAQSTVELKIGDLLAERSRLLSDAGVPGQVEAAMAKVASSEACDRANRSFLDQVGAAGLVHGAQSALVSGRFELQFRDDILSCIAGGANEVLRNVIAERRLKLPRSRPGTTVGRPGS